MIFESHESKDTFEFGKKMAQEANAGDVICLLGDLGVGFYHFDVYRISDVEEMDEIGFEDYIYGNGVCLIEWANLIEEILPETMKVVTIEKDLEKGFDYRRITVSDHL